MNEAGSGIIRGETLQSYLPILSHLIFSGFLLRMEETFMLSAWWKLKNCSSKFMQGLQTSKSFLSNPIWIPAAVILNF